MLNIYLPVILCTCDGRSPLYFLNYSSLTDEMGVKGVVSGLESTHLAGVCVLSKLGNAGYFFFFFFFNGAPAHIGPRPPL
jgi:hypothetical protein